MICFGEFSGCYTGLTGGGRRRPRASPAEVRGGPRASLAEGGEGGVASPVERGEGGPASPAEGGEDVGRERDARDRRKKQFQRIRRGLARHRG